ncbi:MAG: DNA adenine methylase [Candidatus Thermoplasmatota archaeon]|nr:DNA adenine methylase [Candidatus Thermoplasmatota archaeon]
MGGSLLKWAGGKRQMIPYLMGLIPDSFGTYFEPFFGGGALYFELRRRGLLKKAVLSDTNSDLFNLYNVVMKKPLELCNSLKSLPYGNVKEHYYQARELFNNTGITKEPVLKSALLLYLNRHCFNGLFRVNSEGSFNVPFGRYKNPGMPDTDQILSVNEAFRDTVFRNEDFESAVSDAVEGDLVYFDPPYMPVSGTSHFTDYTSSGFREKDQIRLHRVAKELWDRGVYVIISNSSTDFLKELYKDFNLKEIMANRAINSIAERRGKVTELSITNFSASSIFPLNRT